MTEYTLGDTVTLVLGRYAGVTGKIVNVNTNVVPQLYDVRLDSPFRGVSIVTGLLDEEISR